MTAAPDKKALPGRSQRGGKPRPVKCQICRTVCQPGLNLGHQPVGDLIRTRAQLNRPEIYYPMQLYHCPECGLAQLGYVINPEVVYRHFPFVSGTTETATKHLQSLPQRLVAMLGLSSEHFAVDIGSNDGTLLKGWLPYDVRFLGVDPSGDPVRIANEQGLTTWHDFFTEETAERIIDEFGKADVITACGCFAHIAGLDSLMRGIVRLLAEDGVFASDSQYWLDMVERLHYDNIFHQHLRYYSIKSLIYLFARYGLDVFDVERSDVYGGSIRVYGCHAGKRPIAQSVRQLQETEQAAGLFDEQTWLAFAHKTEQRRRALFDRVYDLKEQGRRVIGIGAPAKASTVSVYCRLGADMLDYITEINPLRIGKYLPGTHVPIVDEEAMFRDPETIDAAVLFAWNYHDEIMPKLRQRGFEAEIILP